MCDLRQQFAHLIENKPSLLPLGGVGCPLVQISRQRMIVMGFLREHDQLSVIYSHCNTHRAHIALVNTGRPLKPTVYSAIQILAINAARAACEFSQTRLRNEVCTRDNIICKFSSEITSDFPLKSALFADRNIPPFAKAHLSTLECMYVFCIAIFFRTC